VNTEILQINIFEYSNYRLYLKDVYIKMKAAQPRFSFRSFARAAGFSSPNFLKLVIDEKRNLSPDSIAKLSSLLKLNKEEDAYFRNLVLLNQSKTGDESQFYSDQIIHSPAYRKFYPLKVAQYDYYAHWYIVPIREMVSLPNFKEDPEWIARTLQPQITPQEAKFALQTLLNLHFITRDSEGKLVQQSEIVSTGDEVTAAPTIPQLHKDAVMRFHKEMMRRGAEAIDRFEPTDRDISSLTMNLSRKNANKIKRMVQAFRKELLAISAADKGAELVYELNFQLFPLTRQMVERKS